MKLLVADWTAPLTLAERRALALSLIRSRTLFRTAARVKGDQGRHRQCESLSAAAGDCACLYRDVTGKKVPQ